MIARTLAETGIRPLAQLLLELAIQYLDKPQTVRVGGDMFEAIDPRQIDVDLDVDIDVGIGSGQDQERQIALQQISSIQREMLQQLGLENPLVSVEQYLDTLKRLARMSGIKDADSMFATPEQLAAYRQQQQAQQQQQQQEDPELVQKRAEFDAELQLKREAQAASLELERERFQAEFALKQREMEVELEIRRAKLAMGDTQVSANIPGVS